ncbi:MAG: hypothetical protein PHZ03_02520 [Syntrophomonas sp.]|nr:hypothetical protein [Syntrophomonas sp.]
MVASKQKKVKIQVDMPWGVAAIRGTFVVITVDPSGQSSVGCLTGEAQVTNGGVTVPLTGNQSTQVTQQNAPPPPPVTLPPAAVQHFIQEQTWLQQTAQIMEQNQEATPPPPLPATPEMVLPGPVLTQPIAPVTPITNPAAPISIIEIINQAMQNIGAGTTTVAPPVTTPPTVVPSSDTTTSRNHAPTASGVTISGTARVGQTLTGHYAYEDNENNPGRMFNISMVYRQHCRGNR